MATTARPSSDAFFDCPHGVAPGRMPKADATELAPKKSAIQPSGTLFCGVPEGFCFLVQVLKSQPISLVRLPSGGLGLQNAKIARLLLPGAPNPAFLVPPLPGYRRCLYGRVSYPTPHHLPTASAHHAANLRNQPEIILRTSGATTATHYTICGP